MLQSTRRRIVVGVVAGLLAGATLVSVPNPGLTAMVVLPLLWGLLYAVITRGWWAVVVLPACYVVGIVAGRWLFWSGSPLTGFDVLLGTLLFGAGIAASTAFLTWRDRRRLSGQRS